MAIEYESSVNEGSTSQLIPPFGVESETLELY
jgi:hypothetical protein